MPKPRAAQAVPEVFNCTEFLASEEIFINEVFQTLQLEEDGDNDNAILKKFKPAAKKPTQEGDTTATSVKNELRRKTLIGKKTKKKDSPGQKAPKVKSKSKTLNAKRKENKLLKKRMKKTKLKPETVEEEAVPKAKPVEKQVFNANGAMVFSKFDFSSTGTEKEQTKKTEKNPKKLLKQIAEQKEKIQKLESSDQLDKVEQLKQKQTWQTALKKIQGIKVKDDPELLRKSIKKDSQIKKQSSKKWKERQDNVKKQEAAKQQKRTDNINKRKDQKKANVKKRDIKKGRVVPGF